MNKIYIGDQEINAGGGSGSGGVSDTSFNELAKVTASALLDLKGLEDNIEEFDDKIEGHVEVIDTQIQTLDANKADSSVVYTKKDIDKADKVTAAALASLDSRVSTLESSSGSGGGETFDPSYLEEGLLDVSTRVDALEQNDYVETNDLSAFLTADDVSDFVTTNDISAFVTQSAFDSSYVSLDTSIKALDASALAFDASIKELASSSGGGDSNPAFVKYTNTSDSTKVGIVSSLRTATPCTSIGAGSIIFGEGISSGSNSISFGTGKATGDNSFDLFNGTASGNNSLAGQSATASGLRSIALGLWTTASGQDSVAIGYWSYGAKASGMSSIAIGGGSKASQQCSIAIGPYSESNKQNAIAIGNQAFAYGEACVAIGQGSKCTKGWDFCLGVNCKTTNYYEVATARYNATYRQNDTYGNVNNSCFSIGNGKQDSSRHNAFEVRQSGDIYIPDVSASGEYYEKPMINLQQKIYELEARIAVLESAIQTQ